MKVMALKGFGKLGSLAPYVTDDVYLPWKYNWTQRDIGRVISFGPGEPYSLWGFSDGGTLAYEVAQCDPLCESLIVHSGMFRYPTLSRSIPTLLLTTSGDETPTYDMTHAAYGWYCRWGLQNLTTFIECTTSNSIKHTFSSGLEAIASWFQDIHCCEAPLRR